MFLNGGQEETSKAAAFRRLNVEVGRGIQSIFPVRVLGGVVPLHGAVLRRYRGEGVFAMVIERDGVHCFGEFRISTLKKHENTKSTNVSLWDLKSLAFSGRF